MATTTNDALATVEQQHAVEQFLFREAELLDTWRLRDWLGMLTDDVTYRVPIRIHKEVGDTGDRVTGVMADSFHLDESRTSLEMRVERIETGFAWAEEPPTRTRHLVGNVRIGDEDDRGLAVRSNLLLYHTRWDRPEYTVLSAERHDVLRQDGDRWLLAHRWAVLDNTVVPTLNLSFFL